MSNDIAIVGYAQSPSWERAELTEVQFLFPVIADAIAMAGIDRRDIGFTCAGSCDYLSGQTFAFVSNLEAVGAWPPISESHVEMDGAWAMYEAWVALQHGDIDVAPQSEGKAPAPQHARPCSVRRAAWKAPS